MLQDYRNSYLLEDFTYEDELYYQSEVGVSTVPNTFIRDDWEWRYDYLSLMDEDYRIVKRIDNPAYILFNKRDVDFINNRFYNDYISWEQDQRDDNLYRDYCLGDFS